MRVKTDLKSDYMAGVNRKNVWFQDVWLVTLMTYLAKGNV